MPVDQWNEALRMLLCYVAVAAVAVPIGIAAWRMASRKGESLLPRPHAWRAPWSGFEVFGAFVIVATVVPIMVGMTLAVAPFFQVIYGPDFPPPGSVAPADDPAAQMRIADAMTVRLMWIGLISFPIQIILMIAFASTAYPMPSKPTQRPGIAAALALACLGWALLTLAVFAVHFSVAIAFHLLSLPIEDHPFARITAARPIIDRILFFLQACLAAPILEEILFRGLMLRWLLTRPSRVWPLLGLGSVLAALLTWNLETGPKLGPVLFAVGLLAGCAAMQMVLRKKHRTIGAIYASAALFAVVHSSVWPSPIPLFVLGLGLGWLAVRTRGVLVPIVVHGLFNAVSVVFVLSGG